MQTYAEALDFLMEKLPMFSRIGEAAYKKDLTNIRKLCEALQHPEKQFPSIHIAGTNGKGSVSHMLAAIFQQAGYKTGLYTSPHLIDFRERIRINGAMIPEEAVLEFVRKTQSLTEAIGPSFFELTVAMAFEYFASQRVDIAIVETGLGGRLDSTNILMPELSVITNISFDHQHLLGNTLPAIAGEKAGIIKPSVPVVIGEYHPETFPVFTEKARACNSSLYLASAHWQIKAGNAHHPWTLKSLTDNREWYSHPDLTGIYQQKNIATVLTAIDVFLAHTAGRYRPITSDHILTALSQVKQLTGLRGRWDVVKTQPLVVVDVAHNEAGIVEVMQQTAMQHFRQLHIITGFVKDKDVAAALKQFPSHARYYFTQAQLPRALEVGALAQLAQNYDLQGNVYATVSEACTAALQQANSEDMVLICGSVFVAGEALQALQQLITA
ncbi:bifunctional folylpolyglutamate synthase/dihydrofolate synthase [Thermoflavifilum thermophilum]|uniref:Dihydrofolate synthase/folylpolyglutamate synthase n=1 Tax=Thermoflavifilum thermophilum TaxID=1393122 RepID=A0A1I7N1M7_9BACT|nr:folylpolyglutamate synthase/dihydrofolate synthase family protein [Thermoflavifilum thermophilum]SFV28544.1 dihydrofolate synthase / folylpolyglutamate synthase [Thermoflavifilum thermophilum]